MIREWLSRLLSFSKEPYRHTQAPRSWTLQVLQPRSHLKRDKAWQTDATRHHSLSLGTIKRAVTREGTVLLQKPTGK